MHKQDSILGGYSSSFHTPVYDTMSFVISSNLGWGLFWTEVSKSTMRSSYLEGGIVLNRKCNFSNKILQTNVKTNIFKSHTMGESPLLLRKIHQCLNSHADPCGTLGFWSQPHPQVLVNPFHGSLRG